MCSLARYSLLGHRLGHNRRRNNFFGCLGREGKEQRDATDAEGAIWAAMPPRGGNAAGGTQLPPNPTAGRGCFSSCVPSFWTMETNNRCTFSCETEPARQSGLPARLLAQIFMFGSIGACWTASQRVWEGGWEDWEVEIRLVEKTNSEEPPREDARLLRDTNQFYFINTDELSRNYQHSFNVSFTMGYFVFACFKYLAKQG